MRFIRSSVDRSLDRSFSTLVLKLDDEGELARIQIDDGVREKECDSSLNGRFQRSFQQAEQLEMRELASVSSS